MCKIYKTNLYIYAAGADPRMLVSHHEATMKEGDECAVVTCQIKPQGSSRP